LSEFEASLLELAGGVKTRLEQPQPAGFAGELPPFHPYPTLSAAARARVMVPGSPASRAVDEVVAYFTTPTATDPAGVEFGP